MAGMRAMIVFIVMVVCHPAAVIGQYTRDVLELNRRMVDAQPT